MQITSFKLFLQDYEVAADIGIHDFEVGRKQRLSVDVEVDVNLSLEANEDSITQTVDYDFIRTGISDLLEKRRFNTQEALCLAILALIFKNEHIQAASVKTRKLDVYPDAKSVGCALSANRGSFDGSS